MAFVCGTAWREECCASRLTGALSFSHGHAHRLHPPGGQRAERGHVLCTGARAEVGAVCCLRQGAGSVAHVCRVTCSAVRSHACPARLASTTQPSRRSYASACVTDTQGSGRRAQEKPAPSDSWSPRTGWTWTPACRHWASCATSGARHCASAWAMGRVCCLPTHTSHASPSSMNQSLANASRSLAKLKLKRGLP